MKIVVAATLATLLVWSTHSWAQVADAPTRTMPHQDTCAIPLPRDFWDSPAAKRFQTSEAWTWNERICLGRWADMRGAPGGRGYGEDCQPAKIELKGRPVPAYRELRPEFLELILSHEPWVSVLRRPQVVIKCALVRGDLDLDDQEIAPTFGFHQGKIDGRVNLHGTKFRRSLSFTGSTVVGKFDADRVEIGGGLFLREGAAFRDIDLVGARVAGNVELTGSTVSGKLDADGMEVGGGLHLRDGGKFKDVDLVSARMAGDVDANGATVSGEFNGNRLEVGGSLFLSGRGRFAEISLISARIARDVVLNGSSVTGSLTADQLRGGGSLFMRDVPSLGAIRLLGARIAGDVDLIGSNVTGKINGDSLEVSSRLLLRGSRALADISLLDARVGSDMDLNEVTVDGKLDADGVNVGGSLNMEDSTFTDLDLLGAKVVGAANLIGGTVTGNLAADGVEIGGGLFMRNGGKFGDVSLHGARVKGILQLVGSAFDGEFNLTGAHIAGELQLSSRRFEHSPIWKDGSSLILRSAKVDVLQARRDSWNLSEGDGLLPTDLTGFTFNRLGGIDTSGGASMGDASADWLVGWIEAQREFGDNYDPQPYTQLALALEAAGATDKARAIRYAKFKHKHDSDEGVNLFGQATYMLDRYIWGHRLYPFWVLGWFGVLVGLGWICTLRSKDPSVRRLMGLWYSIENALPLIGMNERFRSVSHGRPWLAHVFHAQKVLGFVLATIFVGALTVLNG